MRGLRRGWSRLRGTFLGRRKERGLEEELDAHIQMLAEERIRRGASPSEALRQAKLQFGSIDAAKESYRDQRGAPALDAVGRDLCYALRGLRKNPGFAAVAILSLGLGIGANTAIFSIVDTVLLQPLAYQDPHRLFAARELIGEFTGGSMPVNPVHALEWGASCPSIKAVALLRQGRVQLTGGGEPASLTAAQIPHNLLSLLGVEPLMGRTFLPEEEQEGQDLVVMLSESLWRTRFDADPSIVGGSVALSDRSVQVVGIAPDRLRLPYNDRSPQAQAQVLVPLVLSEEDRTRPMGNFNFSAVVRLREGVPVEQAIAEMDIVEARFPALTGSDADLRARLIPIHELVTGKARTGLLMLSASVGAVLLIVCLNLANLLLSRGAARGREAAIRTALGASRLRQFCQSLTESLVLAISGGILGTVLAAWILDGLAATATLDIPRLQDVHVDSSVLLFSLGVTVLTGLVFGALPAWRLTRSDPQEALRVGSHTTTEGREGLRLREGLVGLEVGLSAALLIVASLLTSSLTRLLNVDKGFDAEHALTADIRLLGSAYADAANVAAFYDRTLARVAAIPGVQAAGLITDLPTQGESWNDPIFLEGDPRPWYERLAPNNRYASPGYFRAMHIAILQGRAFEESDRGRGVAVLSEKAARALWPGEQNPLGRRFIGEDGNPMTLVGIVADVRTTLENEAPPMAYYPYWQRPIGSVALVVRMTGSEAGAAAVRAALRAEDAQLPIPAFRTMGEVVDGAVAQRRFQLMLVGAFAFCALLIASLGIYGVVSYSVARRRSELGIRMALGAERSRVIRLVIRQGMAPVAAGLGAGVIAAFFLTRAIRGLLFDVQPTDPTTITGVALTLLATGALACLIPARRAARTDAVAALRAD